MDPLKHQPGLQKVSGQTHCHQLQQVWVKELAVWDTNTVTKKECADSFEKQGYYSTCMEPNDSAIPFSQPIT